MMKMACDDRRSGLRRSQAIFTSGDMPAAPITTKILGHGFTRMTRQDSIRVFRVIRVLFSEQ